MFTQAQITERRGDILVSTMEMKEKGKELYKEAIDLYNKVYGLRPGSRPLKSALPALRTNWMGRSFLRNLSDGSFLRFFPLHFFVIKSPLLRLTTTFILSTTTLGLTNLLYA